MAIRLGAVPWVARRRCNACSQRTICGETSWNSSISRWVNGASAVSARAPPAIRSPSCWNAASKVIRPSSRNSAWNLAQNSAMASTKIFSRNPHSSLPLSRRSTRRPRLSANPAWAWKASYSGSAWNSPASLNGSSGAFGCRRAPLPAPPAAAVPAVCGSWRGTPGLPRSTAGRPASAGAAGAGRRRPAARGCPARRRGRGRPVVRTSADCRAPRGPGCRAPNGKCARTAAPGPRRTGTASARAAAAIVRATAHRRHW